MLLVIFNCSRYLDSRGLKAKIKNSWRGYFRITHIHTELSRISKSALLAIFILLLLLLLFLLLLAYYYIYIVPCVNRASM